MRDKSNVIASDVGLDSNENVDAQMAFMQKVGELTRNLHESLQGLGLDKLIQKAAHEIPNVKDRLNYVSLMSEQAAQRVLNATDEANPIQDQLEARTVHIKSAWENAVSAPFSEDNYREMAAQTLAHLEQTQASTQQTKQLLMDIMMAQDFQDLTGQVIKRITGLAHDMEQQLVQLLVDYAPQEIKRDSGLLNGPQINPEAAVDVVADQGQVDDLLESLGF